MTFRAFLAWIFVWAMFGLSMSLLIIHATLPAITETRFTAIVNGHAVECVRRVDRTQRTQSLAC